MPRSSSTPQNRRRTDTGNYALPLQAPPEPPTRDRRRRRIAHGTGSHQEDVLQPTEQALDTAKLALPMQFAAPPTHIQVTNQGAQVTPPSPIRYHRPDDSQWQPLLVGLGIFSVASLLFWLVAFPLL